MEDLESDGKKEIVVGTDRGLLVVLDDKCKKVWSKMLHSPPTVFKAICPLGSGKPWVIVGCEDGTVLALDGGGNVVRKAAMTMRPDRIVSLMEQGVPCALLTTAKGHIRAFKIVE